MAGYAVGILITPFVWEWVPASDGAMLDDVLNMCQALFSVAFLLGLGGLLFRGARWVVRVSVRREPSRDELL